MIRLSTRMYLCLCLVKLAIWEVDGKEGSGMASCSCYSICGDPTSQNVGKNSCKGDGGTFVSMETEEEWEFIKTQIQNRTVKSPGNDEWWIGLEKRDGNWTWLSNHSMTYDKWLRGKPVNNEEKKFATIVKEFNGTQGLFNNTKDFDSKGRICEYTNTNCSGKDKIRWCRSTPRPVSWTPPPLLPTRNTTRELNESGLPRHPSECAVIKQPDTPVIIPIMVALAGLVVIVAINIIIIKWRENTVQESSKKRDKFGSHSEQGDMDPADGTTADMNITGSGIEHEENLQPREDIGKSAVNSDNGTNDIIDIDVSCDNNTAKPKQPYYVNVEESDQHTDTNGHYASVSEVNETDGQRDSFVVVRTYSIVRNDDDGQTDDVNNCNYATVSDTLGTDRQTVTLGTTESGYASVDVINNNSQKGPLVSGHHNEHDTPTNAVHADGSAQYAVIDIQKKNSKKDKTRQHDNKNNKDDDDAPPEVIYDNCQDIPPVQENSTQHTLADSIPNAGAKVEYAVVNKSMKKRNRSVRETPKPNTPTETSYATIDEEYCREGSSVPAQKGSRRKKDNEQQTQTDSVSSGGAKVEYAAVDKSKKRNRSIKPIKPTETSYASIDVEYRQEGSSVPAQGGSGRKKDNEQHTQPDSVSTTGAKVEYAAVDKSKKRHRSVNTAKPIKPTETNYASIDVENCKEDVPVPAQRRSRRKKDKEQHSQDDSVPNAGLKVEYGVVNKSQKKNKSVKEAVKPNEATETSYASVDVIYDNC